MSNRPNNILFQWKNRQDFIKLICYKNHHSANLLNLTFLMAVARLIILKMYCWEKDYFKNWNIFQETGKCTK